MANKQRGEVALEHDGIVHVLRFSINEICDLEDEMDLSINEIIEVLQDEKRTRVKFLRTLFRRALAGGSGADVSAKEAGDLLSEVGIQTAMEKIGEAFQAAFPVAEKENPPKVEKVGTGKNS